MDIGKRAQDQQAGDNSSQAQLIGDNSTQTVVGTQITVNQNNVSVTATDIVALTASVSSQVMTLALRQCTEVAYDVALGRMKEFEKTWTQKIIDLENAIPKLHEPGFHAVLHEANMSAAQTTDREDLDMLAELLAHHIESPDDRRLKSGIRRAIQIVPEVDPESLSTLTVVGHFLLTITRNGMVTQGVKNLNASFTALMEHKLPEDRDWLEHLCVLGAVRISGIGHFLAFDEILTSHYDGYTCVGIEQDSPDHAQALTLLQDNGYTGDPLVQHELLQGYLRLPVSSLDQVPPELEPIVKLYSSDPTLSSQVKKAFLEIWRSYDVLRQIEKWFSALNCHFTITSIGKALIQTNAQRLISGFPSLLR